MIKSLKSLDVIFQKFLESRLTLLVNKSCSKNIQRTGIGFDFDEESWRGFGVIQQLRGYDFVLFRPPISLYVNVFTLSKVNKNGRFWTTTSSWPRGYWTTPFPRRLSWSNKSWKSDPIMTIAHRQISTIYFSSFRSRVPCNVF